MPRTVLVTAFEPFGGASSNPSEAVVTDLQRGWDRSEGLTTAVLPVSFVGAEHAVQVLLAQHRPDVVVAVGLAARRPRVALERIAVNLCDARIPDNDGDQPGDRPVLAGGPLALGTTLPVKAAARQLRAHGIEVDLSTSAGTFVCNAVFYRLAAWAAQDERRRAGFVHVPSGSEQTSTLAVRAVVDAALDVAADDVTPVGEID